MAPTNRLVKGASTRAEFLTEDLPTDTTAQNIQADQSRLNVKLANLITTGQSKLNNAQAIIDNAAAQEVWKLSKDTIQSLLAPVKDVIAVLDVVAQIHPAVSVAVGVFKVVVKLELDRQDNDKHIAVLYYCMTSMLFVLSYLDPVFAHEDGLKAALEKQLDDMCTNINAFGNFCDVYYKQKSFVRIMLSGRYKGKLSDFAQTFDNQKKDLQFLTAQKTAVTVNKIDGTLDDVSDKVNKIVAFLEVKSPKECEVTDMVNHEGGEAVICSNEKALSKIATAFGEEMTTAMKYTLRSDLDELMRSNQALFNLKVETAFAQIKDAVERSTETILLHLDAGPHDLIDDEDIREVWKDMNWRVSCKARHFVDAVHHHFAQKFARHSIITGELHPDQWTLRFMSKVVFYPAIGDAIDEDGSGYVSVYETNRFFRKKPENWTSPQWLAFWAAGWYQNVLDYKRRCSTLLTFIESNAKMALPRNRKHLKSYLGKECVGDLWFIIDAVYTDTLWFHGEGSGREFDALEELRLQYTESEIKAMKTHLQKPKYQLDGVAAVVAIAGTPQLENSIMCLIYLLLRRHKKIIELAQKLVLSEQEFSTMYSSVDNLTTAYEIRFNNLLECWRQQRLDNHLQLQNFAAGMFERWHKEYYDSDESSDSDSDSESGSESGDESEAEIKKQENIANASDADDSQEATEILVFPLPAQPEDSEKEEQKAQESDGTDHESKGSGGKTTNNKKTVEDRVAAVEERLENIEKLLKKVLSATEALSQKCTKKGHKKRSTTSGPHSDSDESTTRSDSGEEQLE